ncbi:hypothetical protein HanPSC8_Chr14g0612971 [Helianthus annuus]|nr:hypothetical protein HanPSC8_Chr14g0612971 [Helianthus annuus]
MSYSCVNKRRQKYIKNGKKISFYSTKIYSGNFIFYECVSTLRIASYEQWNHQCICTSNSIL